MATKHKPLFAPGAAGKQSYSNTGYVILGLVIEKVTGHSVADELSRRIFRPLRLEHTNFPTSPPISGRHAHGYTKVVGPTPVDITEISPSLFGAAGGIISTSADLARFYRALLQGRLIGKRLLSEMKAREGHDSKHPDLLYGLGLYRQPVRCSLVWGHNGEVPGYNTTALNSGVNDAPKLKRRCGASTIASQGRRVRGVRDLCEVEATTNGHRVTSQDSVISSCDFGMNRRSARDLGGVAVPASALGASRRRSFTRLLPAHRARRSKLLARAGLSRRVAIRPRRERTRRTPSRS